MQAEEVLAKIKEDTVAELRERRVAKASRYECAMCTNMHIQVFTYMKIFVQLTSRACPKLFLSSLCTKLAPFQTCSKIRGRVLLKTRPTIDVRVHHRIVG